jgi:hypothetical protein
MTPWNVLLVSARPFRVHGAGRAEGDLTGLSTASAAPKWTDARECHAVPEAR